MANQTLAARPARRAAPAPGADAGRGEPARLALLRAAVEVFGQLGLEGATTRQIARVAGQNQAAIGYHFGSKEGLYLAMARFLVDTVAGPRMDLVEHAEALLARGGARPAQLLAALRDLLGGLLTLMTSEESVAMSRIISREQLAPTAAFDVFYEHAIGRVHRCLAGLLERYVGDRVDPAQRALQAHVLLGSVLGFRVAHATVLRRTGWSRMGPRELERARQAVGALAEHYARGLRTASRAAA